MDIFPAIDLRNGECVRLAQGAFDRVTVYEKDPLLQAKRFHGEGAAWLHVVDLDGAKAGAPQQAEIISALAMQSGLAVQAGGGVRETAHIETLLGAGVRRVIIGSLAVTDPQRVKEWFEKFGAEKIVLAFDVRLNDGAPEIMLHGWQSGSGQNLFSCLENYLEDGLRTVLCTDITRDGMMTGGNTALYQSILQRFPQLDLLASGGVGTLQDIADIRSTGAAGAIVGKALYENRFTLRQALAEAHDAR
ncbi:MAG: 1-(5-phosphoribosyl)-5-[(5-phosphoribosylamino)methylideneamino]imidazole-4-carboxamide isomerase [Pseudomonadota bacterium]